MRAISETAVTMGNVAKAKHVGVYEPHADGHRLKYVQYLLEYLTNQSDVKVTYITSSDTIGTANFDMHLRSHAASIGIEIFEAKSPRELLHKTKLLNIDHLIVPDGDWITWKHLWIKGWTSNADITALVMRPHGQSKKFIVRLTETAIKAFLVSASCWRRNVHVYKLVSALETENTSKTQISDPISFEPDAQELEQIWPNNRATRRTKWVGIVGTLNERKNIPLVLRAVADVENERIGVVLAGRMDETTRQMSQDSINEVRRKGIPIVVLDQILTDGQLDAVLARLHSVVLAHSNEGPSGILGKSIRARTFVVAAGAKSLRKDCQRIRHMSRWSLLNQKQIKESIEYSLETTSPKPIETQSDKVFSAKLLYPTVKQS